MAKVGGIERNGGGRRTTLVLLLAAFVTVGAVAAAAVAISPKLSPLAFHDAMRKLWEDHVTWTRLAIVDIAADAPDTGPTVQRLLQNQVDIGNAVKPFYGTAAGNQLTSLLTTHIILAANILVDFKANDTSGVNDNVTAWYANAHDIAVFLNTANPKNWPLNAMASMMDTHLNLTLQEGVDQLTGNFTGSVSTYDAVHLEILQMADMLSSGIMAQFPSLFSGTLPM